LCHRLHLAFAINRAASPHARRAPPRASSPQAEYDSDDEDEDSEDDEDEDDEDEDGLGGNPWAAARGLGKQPSAVIEEIDDDEDDRKGKKVRARMHGALLSRCG
jgi:hypothetical protein